MIELLGSFFFQNSLKKKGKVDITEKEGLCTLISPDKSFAHTYGFDVLKYCRTVAIAAVVPDNLARVGIDSSADLYSILGELVMAADALNQAKTRQLGEHSARLDRIDEKLGDAP